MTGSTSQRQTPWGCPSGSQVWSTPRAPSEDSGDTARQGLGYDYKINTNLPVTVRTFFFTFLTD